MNQESVRVFHLRRRTNGIPETNGGYAVAVKERKDGRFNVTISQCNENQRYDEKLGEKIAVTRMKQGKYFVSTWTDLVATLNTLHDKLCSGTKPKLHVEQKNMQVSVAANEGNEERAAA
jgi:hypothetical protein